MMRRSLLLLMTGLAMACASQAPETAGDTPQRQTARPEVAQVPLPPDRPQTTPGSAACEGEIYVRPFRGGPAAEQAILPTSKQATLTEEQRRRAVISPDGRWIAIPCDDGGENEVSRAESSQREPNR